jgi:hypothetical protein
MQTDLTELVLDMQRCFFVDDLAGLQEKLRNTVLESQRPRSAPPAHESASSAVRSSHDHSRPHTSCREPVWNLSLLATCNISY